MDQLSIYSSTTANGNTNMTNLIGDILYPDNPKRRDEINKLQNDALEIQSKIIELINSYNRVVKLANDLTAYNVILRALAETSKNPFTEEELRKPQDFRGRAYTEAMATSILDLTSRIVGGAAFGTVFISAIKAFLNRPIAAVAENLGVEMVGMGAARGLAGAEGLAPGVVEGLAGGGAEAAGIGMRGLKYARALRVLKFSGATLVLTVGVEVILGWIEGSRERDVLEENIKKLRKQKADLEKDRDDLKNAKSAAENLIQLALEQFNNIQKDLSEITDIKPVIYKSLEEADNAVNAQKHWCSASGNYLQSVQNFHRKWNDLFVQGKEPTFDDRQKAFADLVSYGLLPNKEEGERRYQIMRRIDTSVKTHSLIL